MKKAALHNLGCKVNAYETEAMRQMLEEHGYEIVPFSEWADVYVINTCSVTNIADRKSRQMIHRARKKNPEGIVVAAGCYVQTSRKKAEEDAEIDILIGNNQKHHLAEILEKYERAREEQRPHRPVDVWDIDRETWYEELEVKQSGEHTRAFVKVQDGCNQFCSYCIIPYARGRIRSRKREDVLEEIRRLAQVGCQEVVLSGIHLSSYGKDTGDSLLELIGHVHEVEGISRIRLGSLEPKIVTESFARELAGLPKLCPHFHLSLQSGCDETLRRMNRKYTCREYKASCELLRSYFSHPAITTDVIVGFPGETEEEFAVTRKFLKEISFYEMHIFKYSKRQGTRAAEMEPQIPEEVKRVRSDILFRDAEEMTKTFGDWYLGKNVEVLLEEQVTLEGNRYWVGHTPEYVKAAFLQEGDWSNHRIKGCVKEILPGHILLLSELSES